MTPSPASAQSTDPATKVERIRSLIRDFRVACPEADDSWLMWYRSSRDDPNYFRLVPDLSEEGDNEYYYDVWVEADLSIDRAGVYTFTMDAVIYNGQLRYRVEETEIANLSFTLADQPTIQAILNNWERAYQKRAREALDEYTAMAEGNLLGDLIHNGLIDE